MTNATQKTESGWVVKLVTGSGELFYGRHRGGSLNLHQIGVYKRKGDAGRLCKKLQGAVVNGEEVFEVVEVAKNAWGGWALA